MNKKIILLILLNITSQIIKSSENSLYELEGLAGNLAVAIPHKGRSEEENKLLENLRRETTMLVVGIRSLREEKLLSIEIKEAIIKLKELKIKAGEIAIQLPQMLKAKVNEAEEIEKKLIELEEETTKKLEEFKAMVNLEAEKYFLTKALMRKRVKKIINYTKVPAFIFLGGGILSLLILLKSSYNTTSKKIYYSETDFFKAFANNAWSCIKDGLSNLTRTEKITLLVLGSSTTLYELSKLLQNKSAQKREDIFNKIKNLK
jgi:hypothetical protein